MARTKISEFSSNPATNTDIDSIFIGEGMAPSNVNDAIRELMAQLKDWQSGTSNDPYVVGSSGSLTLNQGTANGVAYLNGSKVVTSGSALTFNGTNFGVGVSPALARLHTSTNTATTADFTGSVRITNESYTAGTYAGVLFETADTLNSYVTGIRQSSYAGALAFGVNTGSSGTSLSEQMRLTSTGLGIGTSSPAAKLEISGATQATGAVVRLTNSAESSSWAAGNVIGQFDFYSSDSSDPATKSRIASVVESGGTNPAAVGLAFSTYNTSLSEKMRLDSSGNLGLGVTPSAWAWPNGSAGAFQLQSGAAMSAYNATTYLSQNWYYNAGEKYIANGFATRYEQTTGKHAWYTAASGTAGNAVSWTQALTLDASGRWLLGTTTGVGQDFVSIRFNSGGSYPQGMNMVDSNASANGASFIVFRKSNDSGIGSISRVGTTDAVAYNTSSDYRLKNITGPVTTSGDYIDRLNPVEGTWKSDGSTFVGLIAHEVQEASRTQVATGTKDGAEMQSMDYSSSELIANLIAEVKSLRQRVATLEAK